MDTIETTGKYVLTTYKRYPVTFVKGKGCYLYDDKGDKYLDMSSGIAVSSMGHAHPAVVRAIRKQAGKLIHTSNLYYNVPSAKLAKKLVKKTAFSKLFFCNSGAEANEAAIKIARKFGKLSGNENKSTIITFHNSFHGRTMATITATGQPKYQKPFTPLVPGFVYAEYNNLASVEALINADTCAVIVEPLQGEGGVHPADKEFIKGLRDLCDKHNALLVFDEVQTGVGRTGTLFAYEQFAPVVPDAITVAKGIAAGLPMGLILVGEKMANILEPGDHASTFGGNLVSSAAALAVLDCIENANILDNVVRLGKYMMEQLETLKSKYACIKAIRGKGLLVGIEIDYASADLVNELLAHKIITVPAGAHVVRFLPPLIVNKKEINRLIKALDEIFNKRI